MNMFRSLQSCVIGFRSGLWVGLRGTVSPVLLKDPDWWRAAVMVHLLEEKSPICSQYLSCHNPVSELWRLLM